MKKRKKPKFKYIKDSINFLHYYVFDNRKEADLFCEINNIESVGDCGGCCFHVKNKSNKYSDRIVIFYKKDSYLVHELIHATAYLNQTRWRLTFDIKSSEPISYYISWLYDKIKTTKGNQKHKIVTGWSPTNAFSYNY